MAWPTSADVREAWDTAIWQHDDILALTSVIVDREIVGDYHTEVSALRHNQKINFFAYRSTRSVEYLMGEKFRLRFSLNCSYTKWADPNGNNYNEVIAGMETLQELVTTELGSNWGGVVGSSSPQTGPVNMRISTIGDERVFIGEYNYTGLICVTN